MSDDWKQLTIVHLSDMHFGQRHFFNPPAGGAQTKERSLLYSVLNDLQFGVFSLRVNSSNSVPSEGARTGGAPRSIFALTGDFNERCTHPEFVLSKKFLDGLYNSNVLGHRITASDIFIIPGNHDLRYAEDNIGDRWSKFSLFYLDHDNLRQDEKRAPRRYLDPRDPLALTSVIDQSDKGLVVAEINSCAYVEKGTADERRGQLDDTAVDALERQLQQIHPDKLRGSIKVAMIHHHPVVLPVLYEQDKDYDAVLNSEFLFRLLKKYGFHLLLHGHKHTPFTYSYDAVSAWTSDEVQPLLVVAGGSAGSIEIPREQGARNTYNIINIKWHPSSSQARVHVETRGLISEDHAGRLPAPQWHWKTLRTDDRLLYSAKRSAKSGNATRSWAEADRKYEEARRDEMKRLRRNFLAVEVFPSLDKDQAFEARVWIEAQPHPDYRAPKKVEWASNPDHFREIHVCVFDHDPRFSAKFSYFGPTLIRAKLVWDDLEEVSYIYARFPRGDQ